MLQKYQNAYLLNLRNKDEISLIVPINAFKSEEDVIWFKQKLKEK